jgi:hypothetical protein
MKMSLDHVSDRRTSRVRCFDVLLDVALRIDDRRFPVRLDEIRSVSQAA